MQEISRRSMLAGSGATLAALGLPAGAVASRRKGHHQHGGHDGGGHRRGLPIVIGHRGARPTGRSTRSRPTRWRSRWARTTSSPTSCSPRTASSSPATSPISAGRPTSPTIRSSRAAGRTRTIDGVVFTNTLVHLRLHARRAQDAAGEGAAPRRPPAEHGARRAVRDPDVPGGHRPRQGQRRRDLPRDQAPDVLRSRSGFSFDGPLLGTLRRNGLDRPGAKVFIQSFEVGNLQRLRRETRLPLDPAHRRRRRACRLRRQRRPAHLRRPGHAARACARSPPTPTASARTRAASWRATPPATARRSRRRWCATPTASGCSCTRSRSARRTTSWHRTSAWATRRSPEYLHARGDQPAELALYYELGVDGLFADNADTAVAVREKVFGRAPAGR